MRFIFILFLSFFVCSNIAFAAEEECGIPSVITVTIENNTLENCRLTNTNIISAKLYRSVVPVFLQAGAPARSFQLTSMMNEPHGPDKPTIDLTYTCDSEKEITLRSKTQKYRFLSSEWFFGNRMISYVLNAKNLQAIHYEEEYYGWRCDATYDLHWTIFD